MSKFDAYKRLEYCLLISFLSLFSFSCSTSCRQWHLDEMIGSNDCYHSSRLYLLSEDAYCNLELVLIRSKSGIRMYLNTFSVPFPWESNDECKTAIYLCVDGNEFAFVSDRLQGGQRLLLPPDAVELIISTLMNGEQLSVRAGRYQMVVIPTRFGELFLAK